MSLLMTQPTRLWLVEVYGEEKAATMADEIERRAALGLQADGTFDLGCDWSLWLQRQMLG